MSILENHGILLPENDSGQLEVLPGLLRLASGQFSRDILHRFADMDFRYEAQLYLRGRDAAIVVREGELLAYIDGICPSSNDLRLFWFWKNGVSGSVCGLI